MSLNLVLDYENSALAAPQSFRDAMQAAANILDATILDNITVTIRVGYGDWNNNQDTGITTGAEGGSLNGLTVSYASLRAALATHETSTVDQTFVSSLPSTLSLNGVSSFFIPSAVAKAVGLLSPTASTVDGAVGMGTQIPTNLLIGAALHELSHAMGREPGVGPFDLFRYSSPGNHLFTSGSTAVPAYFSIDGGNTKLADFGQSSDASDFLTTGVQGSNDPFDEFYNSHTIQNLTIVDKELLDALGFNTTALVATVIKSAGATSLTEIGNHFYLYNSTGAGPSLKCQGADYVPGLFGAAVVPIGAEATASGYEVAWKTMGTDQYSVWATDNNGNYTSNIVGTALGTSTTLESIESSFHQDLNGDGVIGISATVIESAGATSLTEIGNHFYLYNSTGAGPSLKCQGADYVPGLFGAAVVPIGAEATASGYEVAWKTMGTDQYSVWATDNNGNYTSNIVGTALGTSTTLESIESSFHQDLNGDGVIGISATVIESAGATSLTEIGNHFYLYNSTGAGPSLKCQGADYVPGLFGAAVVPIGAEATASGYEVAWKTMGTDQYSVWATDNNGNYTSNIVGTALGTSTTLESIESSFHQDLNGDGVIGISATVIESAGATSLTEIGNHFYLYNSTGAGPSLKCQGADYVPGLFGAAVVPIGAEATASGYEVAWKTMGTDQYSVWATDNNGNYTSNIVGTTLGTSTTLESIESSFHQDLNGDGQIGVVLNGSSGGQTLTAIGNTTTLIGGPNDILSGGAGADTFVFRPGFGSNTINGFAVGTDTIQFDHTIFTDVADVQSHMQQIGSNVVIAHDPQNVVTLHDVLLANLHLSDFHIV